MTEAEFKKHLDAAEKSPKEIAAAVLGLPEEILRYKPSVEKWCVLEILGHLADVEIVYGYRIRQMLADTKPVIAPLDQNAWARNLNYLDSRPSELVAFYGLGRHHNLRLLRSLRPSDISKSAFHPELQREITVAELVERMGSHGAAHLQQIEKLKTAASSKQR
jgi:DinB superfamily